MTGVGGSGVRTLCAYDVQYQVDGLYEWGMPRAVVVAAARGMMVAEDDGEGMVGQQGERGRRLVSGRQPFCGTATSGSLLFPPPLPPPPPPPRPTLPTPVAATSLLRLSMLSPRRPSLCTSAISSFLLLLLISFLHGT